MFWRGEIKKSSYCYLLFLGIDAVKGAATGIEEFNPRTNTWTQVTTMETRRLQFGVAVVNNKLYVTGISCRSFYLSQFTLYLC